MSGSVTNTTATASTTGGSGGAAAAAASIGGDFNTFLTLLTTQLKNQDPTDAMDTAQMTQQLVSFAQVAVAVRRHLLLDLEKLISLQQTAQLTESAALVGKTVEVGGTQLSLQSGQATLHLPAAGTATRAQISVQNSAGVTLYRTTATLGTAAADWQWNGRTTNGQRLPDGAYAYTVSGLAPDGSAVPLTATVRATATAAELDGNTLKLVLGGLTVPYSQIRSVASP